MNTVKRFSLSGVLVAFVAALLLFGSLLLATTQNAYADTVPDGPYVGWDTSDYDDGVAHNFVNGTKKRDNLAIYTKDGTFVGVAVCSQLSVSSPTNKGISYTYVAGEDYTDGFESGGDIKSTVENLKKVIYVYSMTNDLDKYFTSAKDADHAARGKFEALEEAIGQITSNKSAHDTSFRLELQDSGDFGNTKGAYDYLMGVANGTNSVTVPDGLDIALFKPEDTRYQLLTVLKLFDSTSGGGGDTPTPSIKNTTLTANDTAASDSAAATVEIAEGGKVTLTDKVVLENLDSSKEYEVICYVYNTDSSSTPVSTKKTTVPTGKTEVEVSLEALSSAGTYTVKTELYEKDGTTPIASHNGALDANSETVTVTVKSGGSEDTPTPAIQTSATGTSGNTIEAAAGQTITDTVTYSGLTVGTKYVLEGKLFDKSTGTEITTGYSCTPNNFEPAKSSGKTTVTFTLDATDLAGKSLVVYEYLYTVDANGEKSSEPVAKHEDLTDAKQTVTVNEASEDTTGELATTIKVAGTDADGEKLLVLPQQSNTVPVVDTIEYTDLIKNATYTVTGTLMLFDKDNTTGKEVATKTESALTAADTSGTWTINFGTQTLQPNAYYVVFESATLVKDADGNTVTDATPITHEDIDDLAQAVAVEEVPNITFTHNDVSFNPAEDLTDEDKTKITQPKIGTTASAGGKTATATAAASLTETEAANATSVTDTIAYEGFGQDDTYTVTGTLYKVAMATPSTTTGSSSSTASTTTTTTTNTTPTAVGAPVTMEVSGDKVDKSGKGTWTMTFNSGKLEAGYKYYVQEVVTDSQGNVVASHGDANTPSQCIMVTKATTANNVTGATQTAKTADTATGVALLAALVAAGSAALLLGARRKSHN